MAMTTPAQKPRGLARTTFMQLTGLATVLSYRPNRGSQRRLHAARARYNENFPLAENPRVGYALRPDARSAAGRGPGEPGFRARSDGRIVARRAGADRLVGALEPGSGC